jgi:hypothetical protein
VQALNALVDRFFDGAHVVIGAASATLSEEDRDERLTVRRVLAVGAAPTEDALGGVPQGAPPGLQAGAAARASWD